MSETLTLHVLAPSHPSRAARRALELKGLEFELVELAPGPHVETMKELYGEENPTVPGLLVGDQPVHGSSAIYERLDELQPDPPLYPEVNADAVRAADRWGNEQLQPLGRSLGWGSLHFRPEMLGVLSGGEPLDPAGTDHAMRFIHGAWRYHHITCERIGADLAGLPEKLDHVDQLIADGVIGGEKPNAADLQIGSTVRLLLTISDLTDLIEGRPAARLATDLFPEWGPTMEARTFPRAWIPAAVPS